MTDMETTRTQALKAPAVVEGDSPAGVARARDVARAFVEDLDPPPASETAETFVLVVFELTTNALRHGGGRYILRLGATADAVRVAVTDLNLSPPQGRAPDQGDGAGGFGWPMVRRLASGVTIAPGPGRGWPPATVTAPPRGSRG
ncbi:ATP-binding protein [Streptomyces shenzhenensis]|uniref:ATP-binding protein n=1 Tax=Streptomyces shenzhenensis TaxID=943815 RepID=A0A3M0HWM6_9ACTN|nr:ATP-binding protein [Streptomyces shenzhenensis]RMB80528.1 ATP-binding protein [Streptomyces shenzhenensis]